MAARANRAPRTAVGTRTTDGHVANHALEGVLRGRMVNDPLAHAAGEPGREQGLRVLVLSAPVGESHVEMARVLAQDLKARGDVASVSVLNGFFVFGPPLERILERGFGFHVGRGTRLYDLAYRLFTKLTPARVAGEWALSLLGGRGLRATVRTQRPDVVVSTYPVMNPVLARLRSTGRIRCPVAAVVGPLGQPEFWVQPHLDLHLALYEQAIPGINRLARGAKVVAIRPLVRAGFFEPASRAAARRTVNLPPETPLAVVSGGGWGVGDVSGALDACLDIPDLHVVAVCGRSESLQALLRSRYGSQPRVSVIGFTDRMPDLLRAADVFVTATAGTSCIESRLCGCPVVIYGFGVGHVRDNTRALVRHGLARAATSRAQLRAALLASLGEGRTSSAPLDGLPRAADLVVRLGRRALDDAVRTSPTRST